MENPAPVFGGIDGENAEIDNEEYFTAVEDLGNNTKSKKKTATEGKSGKAKGKWAHMTQEEKEEYFLKYGVTCEQVEKYRKIQISEKEVPHLPVNIYHFLSVLDSLKDPEQWDYELPNHPLRATDERQFEVFWNFAMKVIDEKFAELSRPNKKTLTRNPQWWMYIDYLCQSAIVVHRRTSAANKNLTPEWSRVTQLEFDNFNQMFAEIVKRRIHAHEMLEKAERRAELKAQEKARKEKILDTEQEKAGKTESKVPEKPKTGKTIKVTAEQL